MYQAYIEGKKQPLSKIPSKIDSRSVTPRNTVGGVKEGTKSFTQGYNSMMSDDQNHLMYNQMMHNILETLNSVCVQLSIDQDEAFEKIFFEMDENMLREQVIQENTEISMYNTHITLTSLNNSQQFTRAYSNRLLQLNSHYLEMKDLKDKTLAQIGSLEASKYQQGRRYHFIDPSAYENKMMTSVIEVTELQSEMQLVMYLYVDNQFAYKSKIYPRATNHAIDLDIDIQFPNEAQKIVLEFYHAQDAKPDGQDNKENNGLENSMRSEIDDSDKDFQTKIGKTVLYIDKILQNLLYQEEYKTERNIIIQDQNQSDFDDDDLFSNHSMQNKIHPNTQPILQSRGKVLLAFTAELTTELLKRTEVLKRKFIQEEVDNLEKIENEIEDSRQVIQQAISCLQYMTFEEERGIILDELPMILYNSKLEEVSYIMNRSQLLEHKKELGRSGDISKLKQANLKEIQAAQMPMEGKGRRMCGSCETCLIF